MTNILISVAHSFLSCCIATVSKRLSDFEPDWAGVSARSARFFLHLMVNDDEQEKRKDYEDWPHGHMTDITTKK